MYPSDLSDAEWNVIKPLIIFKRRGIRVEENEVRVNGILYALRTGCQLRMSAKDYGDWNKVYSQLKRWRKTDISPKILGSVDKNQ